jgi:PST family polysaccharide transporter
MRLLGIVILARILLPEQFGLLAMVIPFTGFLGLFKGFGLGQATVQRESLGLDEVSNLFWITLSVCAVLTVLSLGLAPVIGWFYSSEIAELIMVVLSFQFLLEGLGLQHEALLRRQMDYFSLAMVQLCSLFLSVGIGIVAGIYGLGVWALVLKNISHSALRSLFSWGFVGWIPSVPGFTEKTRELLKFGGNLTGFTGVNYLARNADDVLLGRFWNSQVLGFYSKAYQLFTMPIRLINDPLGEVAIPALSRLKGEYEAFRRTYYTFLQSLLLVTTPLAVVMVVCADSIVSVLLGPGWQQAGTILRWLGVAAFIQPVANSTGWLFVAQDRTDEMARWGLIGASTAIGSFLIGLPWGGVGMAMSYSLVAIVLRFPLLLWFVSTPEGVSIKGYLQSFKASFIGLTVTLSINLTLSLVWDPGTGWVLLIVHGLLTITIFLFTVSLIPSGRSQLDTLRSLGMKMMNPE